MSRIDLNSLSIAKTRELVTAGDISCRELVEIYHGQIKEHRDLNAYLEVFDDAYELAEKEDIAIKSGQSPKLLSGVALAIKDNMLIKNKKITAGSKMLEGYTASYDAYVIKKLRDAGVIFLGRTNMDEFAMGSSCENSAYGVTKNPWDHSRVPGGSSGGSAAAVASHQCLAALGSDTGGSIREPASFCGTVGLKPTYGSVSRSGLIAMASSLDVIGPFTKSVDDAEEIFKIILGKDPKDATTVTYITKNSGKHPVIGVPREFFSLKERGKEGVDGDVAKALSEAIDSLKSAGYEIKEVSLPNADYALACYYILMPAEVSSNLARFDGIRYGARAKAENLLEIYANTRGEKFGREVRRRIILGTYVLSAGYYDAYYSRAEKVRWLIRRDFENVFRDVDVIISPTVATPAFKIGEKTADPLSMYLSDIFTIPANLAGIPAMSVPFGFAERDGKKLPIGVQLMAPRFAESVLFDVGRALERARSV
ncbi:MAG: Asp-tRNA(Asn)/Glu-tRNA(Gln) amidotransferase subunit GatA [Candidatus Niyogibacteria bacterium]|nr:Asp-tRNA(Asn)/Glu-tRNA(Gln) amidotransferase subunit GatA [Candidatus Niyogibacteria bacterium]